MGLFLFGGFLLLVVGFVLFGLATWRARVLPRWAGLLVVAGVLIDFAAGFAFGGSPPLPVGIVLASAGFAWMGYALATQATGDATVQPAAPSPRPA